VAGQALHDIQRFLPALVGMPADWTRVNGPKITHIKVILAPIASRVN
jgi:hypothetical protein